MIIQGMNNIASAYGATFKSTAERQTSPAITADVAEKVTLSSQGKALASSEQAVAKIRTPVQEKVLRAASSDPASAEKIAYQLADGSSQICYSSIHDMGPDGKLNRLASSGRIIDQNFRDKFSQEASVVDAQTKAIYDSETAKGTDPVKIISMIFDHINSQSSDYLEATGWGWNNGVKILG